MMNVHDILKIVTDVLRLQYGIEVEERYISQTVSVYESRDMQLYKNRDLIISKKNALGLVDDNTGNVIRTVREIKYSRLQDVITNRIDYKYDKNNNISGVTIIDPSNDKTESMIIHNEYNSDGKLISSVLDDTKFKLYNYSSGNLISMQHHNGTFGYLVTISYSNNGEYCTINIHDIVNRESLDIRIIIYFKKCKFSGDGWDMMVEVYVIQNGNKNIRIYAKRDMYVDNTKYDHGSYYYRKPIAIEYSFSAGINTAYNGYISFMIPVNLFNKK